MHPFVYKKFGDLLTGQDLSGPVLEVGAVPNEKTLLNLPELKDLKEKIGINLVGPYSYKDFVIHKCDANKMDLFQDNYFGLVLCNAMLEHDMYFWKTIAEIKRVTKPGGLVMIGTPGFAKDKFQKFKDRFSKSTWYKKLNSIAAFEFFMSSTLTFKVHGGAYGDFYRFSPAAYKEVFFKEYENVSIVEIMQPPRIIGWGIKPDTK